VSAIDSKRALNLDDLIYGTVLDKKPITHFLNNSKGITKHGY